MTARFDRRQFVKSIVGSAAALAVPQIALAQYGPVPGKILLRYNENPYGPSARGLEAGRAAAAAGAYYPGSIESDLQVLIARRNGLSMSNVVLSSGSNEALQAAMMAYGRRGKIIMPAVTYMEHVGYATRKGVQVDYVPLTDDLSIDLEAMAAAVDDTTSLVYICNPNNPTGKVLDGDELRAFCREVGKRAVVMVDEAYNEITDDPDYTSVVDLVREDENVIVMRTFSKLFGMAGFRVGYGMARPDIARRIGGHIMAWPNGVGLAVAHASYTDDEFIEMSKRKIIEGRKMIAATLRRNGIEPLPSQTNFLYADIGRSAEQFVIEMAARNVVIRANVGGPETYIRVSTGKLEDLKIFDKVFTDVYTA